MRARHTANRCTARTREGLPCRFPPLRGTSHCFVHSELAKVQLARHSARVRGGRNRLKYLPKGVPTREINGPEDLHRLLVGAIEAMRCRKLDIRSAVALIYAADTALRAYSPDGDDRPCLLPPDVQIGVLKELTQIAESAGLAHGAYLRELDHFSTRQARPVSVARSHRGTD